MVMAKFVKNFISSKIEEKRKAVMANQNMQNQGQANRPQQTSSQTDREIKTGIVPAKSSQQGQGSKTNAGQKGTPNLNPSRKSGSSVEDDIGMDDMDSEDRAAVKDDREPCH